MFQEGFLWGAATSAYQIEGAWDHDGKGPSIWDDFCRRPGVIEHGDTGDIACDHYHRLAEDVAIMRDLGLQAYRFSVSWPRILPEGQGDVNPAGLDFYSRLVDLLLEAQITPIPTLFHWDYPLALHHRGGWLNATSPVWFARYARVVADALGDRVATWITLNEPQVFVELGYGSGVHAPGLRLPLADRLRVAHHLVLAHNLGAREIAEAVPGARISWAPVAPVAYPATPADEQAARARTLRSDGESLMNLSWMNHAVMHGHYPSDGLVAHAHLLPKGFERDLDRSAVKPPFLAINLYVGTPVETGEDGSAVERPFPPGYPRTAFGWPVTPEALYWAVRFTHEQYPVPIMISENGMANLDWPDAQGRVRDPQRIEFTRRYLLELARAGREGVPLLGYMHWSLMDNFEWAKGFDMRFGLVHVDFETRQRTIKDSGHWYARVIQTNGASIQTDAGEEPIGAGVAAR